MKQLVADAGPILHLHQAAALHLFPLIGEVTTPTAVLAEVRVHAPTLWATALPPWMKIGALSAAASQRAQGWLQAGLLHGGRPPRSRGPARHARTGLSPTMLPRA